jgi:hypothetical protein
MSREIRRVPKDWEHPREAGHYKPLLDKSYSQAILDHIKGELPWYLRHPRHLKEWFECWPDREYCRPHWSKSEATHYQIYEDVSEGTPVSPIFENLGEMKAWLLEQGFSEKASSKFIEDGWAPSMIFSPEKGLSGIGIHSLDYL